MTSRRESDVCVNPVEADFRRSPRPGTRLHPRACVCLGRACPCCPELATPLYSAFARVCSCSQGSDHSHTAAASPGAVLLARAQPSSALHPPPPSRGRGGSHAVAFESRRSLPPVKAAESFRRRTSHAEWPRPLPSGSGSVTPSPFCSSEFAPHCCCFDAFYGEMTINFPLLLFFISINTHKQVSVVFSRPCS